MGGCQYCRRVSLATKGTAWVSLWTHHMCREDQQWRRWMTERRAFHIREEMRHLNRKEWEYIDRDPWEMREIHRFIEKKPLYFLHLLRFSFPVKGVHKSFKVFLPSERPTIFLSKFLLFWNFYFLSVSFSLGSPRYIFCLFSICMDCTAQCKWEQQLCQLYH